MPYKIEKRGNQFVKIRQDTGKIVSRHATRAKAVGSIFAEIAHTGEDVNKVAPGVDLSRPHGK